MEMFGPRMGTLDYDTGTVTYWGDGNQVIDCTSVESTAAMLAHIALDRSLSSGKFSFASDRISILDATKVIEAQTGRTFERKSNGSEADLRAAMGKAKADPKTSVMLAYQLYMLNGQTALTDLKNGHYPGVNLESFAEFAARALPHRTVA